MSNQTIKMTQALHSYLLEHSLREPDVLRRLREETATLPEHNMQISPEQGQFMQLLLRLMSARRGVEIGTFTGYSTLAMAQALPENGRIVACDVSEQWTGIARRYWEEAGVGERITLRLGPASETLAAMVSAGEGATMDFAFIDADKVSYIDYYEKAIELLRPGGLIMVDNILWNGRVADDGNEESATVAIRAFNERVHDDTRVDLSMVPIGDGLTLARKR